MQPEERYLRQTPNLVRAMTLAGPGMKPRLQKLATLRERIEIPIPAELLSTLPRMYAKLEETNDFLDLINYERFALYATPIADLPDQVLYLLDKFRGTPLKENPAVQPFSGAGAHLVETDPVLVGRLKIASVMLRLGQDTELASGDVAALRAGHEGVFSASHGLYDGVYVLDTYFAPLHAALAPGVWGFGVPRSFGSLVIELGRTAAGTRGEAAEMLQLISVAGPVEQVAMVEFSDGAAGESIAWWGAGLNRMFGVLSDLAVFTDEAGVYRADKHLQAMLTVEQIFLRTTSAQVAHRDANARRTLMFSVLDSLERVNGWDLSTMLSLSHARRVLADLESIVPQAGAEILLPAPRRAVEALRRVQEGFFIARQRQTESVELLLPGGEKSRMSLEVAATSYLKLLRNATHGHGGKGKAMQQTAALLAHHDGHVPHDIGLLAYLYLLDLLAHPDRLRRCLYRAGK